MTRKKKGRRAATAALARPLPKPPLPISALLVRVGLILTAAAAVQHFLPPSLNPTPISTKGRTMRRKTRQQPARRPADRSEPPRFTVGRDHHGWWVVEDRFNRVGGIFTSEDAAMHYALEECSKDRAAVRRQRRGTPVEFRLSP
jgi:hypothetical protein